MPDVGQEMFLWLLKFLFCYRVVDRSLNNSALYSSMCDALLLLQFQLQAGKSIVSFIAVCI